LYYVYDIASNSVTSLPYPFGSGSGDNLFNVIPDTTEQNVYFFNKTDNSIYKYNVALDSSVLVAATARVNPDQLDMIVDFTNNILYYSYGIYIFSVNLTASFPATPTPLAISGYSFALIQSIAINRNGTYLFVSDGSINQIVSIQISTGIASVVAGNSNQGYVDGPGPSAEFNNPIGITVNNSSVQYVADNSNNAIRAITNFDPDPYVPPGPAPPCFKEGTKILTDKGYVPIETLKPGDKVQTLKEGFVAIHAIGKRVIKNPRVEERVPEQLYVCSPSKFSDVFEDLIITGYHSLLSQNFESDEQIEETRRVLGKIYITDGYYRIPICIDKRAEVYREEGTATIYHFALEHHDYDMNHGVYANGLLVESTSKKYLLERSGMELL
jgi:hypothetical protein